MLYYPQPGNEMRSLQITVLAVVVCLLIAGSAGALTEAKIVGSSSTTDARFGRAVSIEGDTAIVSAYYEDGYDGAVYI